MVRTCIKLLDVLQQIKQGARSTRAWAIILEFHCFFLLFSMSVWGCKEVEFH
jgi:hypothetical protein